MDHHTLVPQYHLLQITHHLSRRHIPTSHSTNKVNNEKIPYEKITKKWRENPPSLLNDEMFLRAKEHIKDVDIIGELNNTVSVNFSANSSEVSDLSDTEHLKDGLEDVHRMELEAFGRQLKLTLKKQDGLLKKDGLKMWRIEGNDSQPHGIDYVEMESVSVLMVVFHGF